MKAECIICKAPLIDVYKRQFLILMPSSITTESGEVVTGIINKTWTAGQGMIEMCIRDRNYIVQKDPEAFVTVYTVSDMRYRPKVRSF